MTDYDQEDKQKAKTFIKFLLRLTVLGSACYKKENVFFFFNGNTFFYHIAGIFFVLKVFAY